MTVEQKQCLLKYLGYYADQVDGRWGPNSRAATEAFQRDFTGLQVDGDAGEETQKALRHAVAYGMPEREEPEETKTFWDDLKYFRRDEPGIKCPCPRCGGFPVEPTEKLMRTAEMIREHFDSPMNPSSTVRCPEHNAELQGSSPTSRHMQGKAMDFAIRGVPGYKVLAYTTQLRDQGVIRYTYQMQNSEYVHIDVT